MMTWEAEARLRIAREQIMSIADEGVEGFGSVADALKLQRLASEIETFRESLAAKTPRLDEYVLHVGEEIRKAKDANPHHEVLTIDIHESDAWRFLEAMGLDGPEGDNA